MAREINHDWHRFLGTAVVTISVFGFAVAPCTFTVMAQSASDILGPAAAVALASELAARIVVDPPLAEPLAHGRVVIQYRAENLRIVPVFVAPRCSLGAHPSRNRVGLCQR